MSVVDELREKIDEGRIVFDAPSLRGELLGENAGTRVSPALQALVLELSLLAQIRVSSLVRASGHHGSGRAVDIGNEGIAATLLPQIATDARVQALGIDEIIFDASVVGEQDRNRWNYDRGQRHDYDAATLNAHRNHVHFAVR